MKDRDQKNKAEKNKVEHSDLDGDGQRHKKLKPLPKEKYDWRKMQEEEEDDEEE